MIPFYKISLENNISVQNYPEKPTFYHHNGRSRGQIDYIFMIEDDASVIKVDILDIDLLNCSDHIPVLASIPCQCKQKTEKPKTIITKVKWDRCDRETYKAFVANDI